jgi:hypothetical protein
MSFRRGTFTLLFTLAIITLTVAMPNRSAKADDAATKITINMDEYHFTVEGHDPNAPIILKAGVLYDMTIKNTGKLSHEIWWGKDPLMVAEEGRLDGYKTNLLADVPVVIIDEQTAEPNGYEINVPGLTEIKEGPGQSFTIEFTLPDSLKGKWEVGCFQPMPKAANAATADASTTPVPDIPHYMVSMKADLIVQ